MQSTNFQSKESLYSVSLKGANINKMGVSIQSKMLR